MKAMSDPTTLLALAERCEQAAGPDRVLDAEITKSFIPRDATHVARSRDGWSFIIAQEFEWLENQPYTASLDAAVTLVPDGWRWAVSTTGGGLPCAYGHPPGNHQASNWIDDTPAATPALAICAFALRARAAMSQPSSDT
jgi:hypothetical protein